MRSVSEGETHATSMILLTIIRAAVAVAIATLISASPTTAGAPLKTLPLQRGYYVSADTPCGAASAATLVLVGFSGIGTEQAFDKFKHVEKIGPATYRVTAARIDQSGGTNGTSVSEYEINSPSSYRQKNEFGMFAMRFCSQPSLPAPWRANDIKALIGH